MAMIPASHRTPPEVLELFIDELGSNVTQELQRRHALEACALVCRAFRDRSQHYLFQEILFVQPAYCPSSNVLSQFWKFRELIKSGSGGSTTSILHHVRSFGLTLNGSMFDAYAILGNEDLVGIMHAIHKESLGIHSLSLCVQDPAMPINLPALDQGFHVAFDKLLLSTCLASLQLCNIIGVPRSILTGTKIRNLQFHIIGLAPELACILPPAGQIESLDVDFTFPFQHHDGLNQWNVEMSNGCTPSCHCLANVAHLKFVIYNSEDINTFVDAALCLSSSLESVELELSDSAHVLQRNTVWRLPFGEMPCLKLFVVRLKSPITVGTCSLLLRVADILDGLSIPPSLDTIQIGLDVRSIPPWSMKPHFFPEPAIWATLDNALHQEKYDSVTRVVYDLRYHTLREEPWAFDEGIFRRRCSAFLRDAFPLLASSRELVSFISISSTRV